MSQKQYFWLFWGGVDAGDWAAIFHGSLVRPPGRCQDPIFDNLVVDLFRFRPARS